MRIYIFYTLLLTSFWAKAQIDTPCLASANYYECLVAKEPGWLKTSTVAKRKNDSLIIKTNDKKIVFKDIIYKEELENRDSVRNYIFIKQLKGYAIVERVANFDGNTWILINLSTGKLQMFDALPIFSPSMKRMMVVSGKLHNPFTSESVYIYKPKDNKWVEEYKTDAKPFEAYGSGKWTGENRVVLKKYDWEAKTKDGLPLETETVAIYEFNEWRKITKKEK
jgi:hypothetical protein